MSETHSHHSHHHRHPHSQRRAVDLRIPAIEKYAYCLCLHVKPTTIFIAVFKLIRALLFASILLNTEFTMNEQVPDFGTMSFMETHRSTEAAVDILSRIVTASVSAVAIYAVISGRAALLMPLYALLLVDFFFALPAFYNRELDPSIVDTGLPGVKNYPGNNPQYARYPVMLFSTITMVVKIYFLCVIWKCYRYLRLIELVTPIRLSEFYPHIHPNGSPYPIVRVLGSADSSDVGSGHNVAPPPYDTIASSMKPPNYEEAMKTSNSVFPASSPTFNLTPAILVGNPVSDATQVIDNPSSNSPTSNQPETRIDMINSNHSTHDIESRHPSSNQPNLDPETKAQLSTPPQAAVVASQTTNRLARVESSQVESGGENGEQKSQNLGSNNGNIPKTADEKEKTSHNDA